MPAEKVDSMTSSAEFERVMYWLHASLEFKEDEHLIIANPGG